MKNKEKTMEQLKKELAEMKRRVAECKKHEKELKNKENRFRQESIEYEKLSALGRLTANISHEIRNPITVIGGLAKRLQMNSSLDPENKEDLNIIIWEAEKLESILKNVLSFSGKTVFRREENNVNEIVAEQLKMLETACHDRSIAIHKDFRAVPRVFIDKKQFNESVRNVLSNAVDAMPDGGELSVATHTGSRSGKNYVIIEISDTGVGIPDESTSKIFEPFFSTKVAKKETGLGLSITKKILEAHGGFIEVESTIGKGSTFCLYFPYRFVAAETKNKRKKKRV